MACRRIPSSCLRRLPGRWWRRVRRPPRLRRPRRVRLKSISSSFKVLHRVCGARFATDEPSIALPGGAVGDRLISRPGASDATCRYEARSPDSGGNRSCSATFQGGIQNVHGADKDTPSPPWRASGPRGRSLVIGPEALLRRDRSVVAPCPMATVLPDSQGDGAGKFGTGVICRSGRLTPRQASTAARDRTGCSRSSAP